MFVFFSMADAPLFVRDDPESATWSVDQLSLQATFPYDPAKEITRGMRIGFQYDSVWQVFEIRKVRNYEPGHYQEITAEHIAVSELTDEVYESEETTDETAANTLSPALTNTLWEIGTNTDNTEQSMDANIGNVWSMVRDIENDFNVIISPRVTMGANGITGRYLDIAPNVGTWRGVRLSLEKNADEVGVTWDDTDVATALYAYGAEEDDEKLTFAEVEWAATADHPAKPLGQTYLEDPTAKALYGRNGRNRWSWYQNANIKDAEILLEKTWETLKTINAPKVTVNCLVRDLYRLGYHDEPIKLHDKVIVDISPEGKTLTLDVIKLDIDLLDPTATRPTIGAYIPNIVYIDRSIDEKSGGGGGGHGQNKKEVELTEFNTRINANGIEIKLEAYQRAYEYGQLSDSLLNAWASINLKSNQITSLVTGTGAQLDSDGNLIVDQQGNPIFTTTGAGLYSKITQNAQAISLKVSQGDVATELAVECGNVTISGGNLVVDGYVTATAFNGLEAEFDNLTTGVTEASWIKSNLLTVSGSLSVGANGSFFLSGTRCFPTSKTIVTGVTVTMPTINLSAQHNFGYFNASNVLVGTETGMVITSYSAGSVNVTTDSLLYVGYNQSSP